MEKADCPECRKKDITARREKDGLGFERPFAPLRFDLHAGRRWGRPCKMSGEMVPTPNSGEVKP